MENEKRREHIDFTTPREREAQLLDMEKGSSWENMGINNDGS